METKTNPLQNSMSDTQTTTKEEAEDVFTSLESIVASLPGCVYWKDRKGIYRGCNDLVAKLAGYESSKDIIGKTDRDLAKRLGWSPEVVDAFLKIDKEIMETGVPQLNIEEPPFQVADGRIMNQLTNKMPLYNVRREVIGVLGISIDITERKKLESLLRQEKEKAEQQAKNAFANLEEVILAMPGSVYWKDKHGVYQGCNERAMQMVGVSSKNEFIGKTDFDFAKRLGWDDKVAEAFCQVDKEVMETGVARLSVEEPPFQLADGSTIHLLTNKVPLRDNKGNVVGIVGLSVDISDRKEVEKELQEAKERAEIANHTKSEFLSMVSHEFRLPLTAILGMADLLTGPNVSVVEQQQYIQQVQKAGTHLLSLVNSILDFAKLEAGKLELEPLPIDLKMLIEDTATMLVAQAKAHNLELIVSYEQDVPHKVIGDSRSLRQILVNFVGNAIKFTPKGYVSIKVSCLHRTAETAQLDIAIEDTGIGIPPDKFDLIFDRFAQADASHTRAYGGTGLGLAICKKLVELMNGEIKVESEVGIGTTFHCLINFPLQDESIVQLPWVQYQANVRTLVVDDTPKSEVLSKHIGNSQAISGGEALNTIISAQNLEEPFDVMIIDGDLATANPYELVQQLHQRKNLTMPMTLLLMSRNSLEDKKKAQAAGFFASVAKPVQPIELQTILTTAWEKWEEARKRALFEATAQTVKVLLVEDDELVQFIHKRFLEDMRCIVDAVDTGRKTMALLNKENNRYDIILMDVGLPDIEGPKLAQQIRDHEKMHNKARVPIIALTGYSGEEYLQTCLDSGMDGMQVKPVKREELYSLLQSYFSSAHLIDPSQRQAS